MTASSLSNCADFLTTVHRKSLEKMLKISELKTAFEAKQKLLAELQIANDQIASLTQSLTESQATAASEKERADALQAQIDEANQTIESLNGKVTGLESERKTVSQAAVEKMHELGVAVSEVPKTVDPTKTDEELLAHYQGLTGREKTLFFREKKAVLQRAAAASK